MTLSKKPLKINEKIEAEHEKKTRTTNQVEINPRFAEESLLTNAQKELTQFASYF